MSPAATARTDWRGARPVNTSIDRALLQPTDAHFRAVTRMFATTSARSLAERVRRRATMLARRERRAGAAIVEARDRLMLTIYAQTTPAGWYTAWSDGSVAAGMAGIGGLFMNPSGRIVAELARRVSDTAAFEAEVAALAAVLQLAHAQDVRRLRVYSDCIALARMWHRDRDDPRLATPVALARRFARLEVTSLPRLHNQPAHRLAKSAAGHTGA